MESFFGGREESREDVTKRKGSKVKSLKTRFFRRGKKTDAEADAKISQSASDIMAGIALGSDEDLASQGTMGSRAFSHDSIFLADEVSSDPDPVGGLSQENVHSKIKSLQMKLQLQKMHFGPPPMVLPVRSPEETAQQSEDFPFPGSLETSGEGSLTTTTSTSPPVSPISRLAQTRSPPQIPLPLFGPNSSSTPTAEAPVDFSTPAEFTASLDTSAARHRMSIKPRNQRVSVKKRPSSGSQSESPKNDLKTPDRFELEPEKEQEVDAQEKEAEETEKGQVHLSQLSPQTSEEVSPVSCQVAPKLPSERFAQVDSVPPETEPFPVLRPKPPRRLDALHSKRPHSSYVESEIKELKGADLEGRGTSQSKRSAFFASMTDVSSERPSPFSSLLASRASSAQQQQPQRDEDTSTRIKRPSPGSGSFHLSRNREEDRPRSGSFTGVPEKPEAKTKTFWGAEEKITREKEEPKSLQSKGSLYAAERTGGSSLPWERDFSFKKAEPVSPAKNGPSDMSAVEAEGVDGAQGQGDEAEEAQELPEGEPRSPFGVKLRSTSHSFKFRSETASQRRSSPSDYQEERKKRQNVGNSSGQVSEKLPSNTSCVLKSAHQAPSGVTLPVRRNASLEENPHTTPTEVQTTSSHPGQAETAPPETPPTPQTSSSEASWMSLAMEKTRSIQQLFTSRFQRDFTGAQNAARPKSQEETLAGSQVPAQAVKVQPSSDTMKEEAAQSGSQEQAGKLQKKRMLISQFESYSPRESPVSRQTSQTLPNRAPPDATLSPHAGTTSPFTRGNAPQLLPQSSQSSAEQPASWSNRGVQLTAAPPAVESAPAAPSAAAPLDSSPERREREASFLTETPSLVSKRVLWTGSVADRAAFLEKRAEHSTSASLKEVEPKKAQTQTSGDADTLAKLLPLSKAAGEIRQVAKSAESSPSRVLERPREDKWPRKTEESPSSPSSLRTHSSVLQSDSGQPSWMELAKRKSMAWSDKSMD
ncbi:CRACD-like protein isoform X1 [Fundulus heteroclitus]|uniref:CRACD-like protein isoform X1 n=2 Tax=Fundulus heteroclitus TaxID=8078 RepID=UPI00165C74A6|nr:CRACD-like protein isoform X1 [Fundulus heteroclitus]XP_021173012.2 CRACD-like protein isoform X1 [Fundulus heteroclitus]